MRPVAARPVVAETLRERTAGEPDCVSCDRQDSAVPRLVFPPLSGTGNVHLLAILGDRTAGQLQALF